MIENILCAAIWYKDLETISLLPKNIDKGVVICGYRHGNCIRSLVYFTGLRSVNLGDNAVGDYEQGFLTSENRFVDREEAAKIALNAGQIKEALKKLYSEDLY